MEGRLVFEEVVWAKVDFLRKLCGRREKGTLNALVRVGFHFLICVITFSNIVDFYLKSISNDFPIFTFCP